jgi:choice-of-anchor B domain-containing protein
MKKSVQKLMAFIFSVSFLQANAQVVYDAQNISILSNWDDSLVPANVPPYGIRYNGIWGWDDGTGNEYAIIGANNGVYFVNVTNPTAPVTSDFVAGKRDSCIWREIKTYDHYAYLISDDASPNSFQIVDLQYLPDSVSVVYDGTSIFERGHTLFVDGNKLYVGIVKGGQFANTSAMAVFSLANPELPTFLRSLNTDYGSLLNNNQVHDMFVRNDTVYASCAYDGLFIFKYNTVANNFSLEGSLTSYPQQGYNHSSALTEDGSTLVFMDEVPNGLAVKVLDVTDFSNLTMKSTFSSNPGPTPHNPFMVGTTCYIAYYQDGLQVYDVSNPLLPVRLGYFDTHYQTPMGGPYSPLAYEGAWGAYPYLPSGNVLVSDMQNGLFVLDVSQITASVQEQSGNVALSVYPNPAGGDQNFTVQLSGINTTEFQLSIHDISGRLVYQQLHTGLKADIEAKSFSSGMYTLSVLTDAGRTIKKLVIE